MHSGLDSVAVASTLQDRTPAAEASRDVRPIAFYLPQYHPIPENDRWWGKGFTEWINAAKARPLFRGHYQPHLPADLGFYDLRLPEVRQAQADLAREYGIGGFCYYHYWFNGKRLLERPFQEVLESGKPDFPFCLCWANENWTRTWDGKDQEILQKQVYSPEDDQDHLRHLADAFRDPRYIRVNGRPLFLVYRASSLPDPASTTAIWREEARRLGLGELYLCRVETSPADHADPRPLGFDAAVEFQPDWFLMRHPYKPRALQRWASRLGFRGGFCPPREAKLFHYAEIMRIMLAKPDPEYLRYRCVVPSWDNTARRGKRAAILHGSTPELYQQWLEHILEQAQARSHPLVFINGWNEWAEGNHLEPDQRHGHQYLQATARALAAGRRLSPTMPGVLKT